MGLTTSCEAIESEGFDFAKHVGVFTFTKIVISYRAERARPLDCNRLLRRVN